MRLPLHHPDISYIFSIPQTYHRWLDVEQAAASAGGFVNVAYQLMQLQIEGEFVRLVEAIDAPTRFQAFIQAVEHELERQFSEDREHARFIHFGLSEQNVIDTGHAIACRAVTETVVNQTRVLTRALDKTQDDLHGATRLGYGPEYTYPVPTSRAVLTFLGEINRCGNRVRNAADEIPGNISGPLGDFPFIDPMEIAPTMSRLGHTGLDWDSCTNGIVPRDRLTVWVQSMVNLAMAVAKFALFLFDEQIRSQAEIDSTEISTVVDSAFKARMYGDKIVHVASSTRWDEINRVEAEFIPLLCDYTALAVSDMHRALPDVTFIARGLPNGASAFHELHKRIMNNPLLSRRTVERQVEEERR